MTTTREAPDVSAIIALTNGASPLVWQVSPGGEGLRPFVGTVLASLEHNERDPYVVWAMASDDGKSWECWGGHYCGDYHAALEAFAARRMYH